MIYPYPFDYYKISYISAVKRYLLPVSGDVNILDTLFTSLDLGYTVASMISPDSSKKGFAVSETPGVKETVDHSERSRFIFLDDQNNFIKDNI